MKQVEIHTISKAYEHFRLRDRYREKLLLQSILEHGIREPLQCVQAQGQKYEYILLDGYKRLRCSYKLKLHMLPVVSLGTDETACILRLIRSSTDSSLSTLEQARFVDELHNRHGLSLGEIADSLERSKAWVSLRLGIIDQMSQVVRKEVFSGRFPVRCYLYTLRPFTRVNSISSCQIDRFVQSVSGKGLSTRDIDRLAYGYFRGAKQLKRQILQGNLQWTLRRMRNIDPAPGPGADLSEVEWSVIRDLQLCRKYISRICSGLAQKELGSQAFHAQASLLIQGLLSVIDEFSSRIRSFYESRGYQADGQNLV